MNKVGNLYCLITALACLLTSGFKAVTAQEVLTESWKTGTQMERQLLSEISVRWSGQELRTALQNLSEAQHIAIFLDRRVDPNQTLELTITDTLLVQSLQKIADSRGLGYTLLDSVSYFGPTDAAADLRTLAALAKEEAQKAPAKQRAILLDAKPLSWPELSRPRELIAQLVEDAGLKLVGLERVPHDLWPAGSWPEMSLIDRLSLLAIGFDLQVRVSQDGSAVALVPRVKPALMVKSYPAKAATKELQQEIAQHAPDADLKFVDGKLFVRGRLEDQEYVETILDGSTSGGEKTATKNPADKTEGIKVYTLTIMNQPLLPVVKALAKQMNLQVALDEEMLKDAGIEPAMLISFEVKEATTEKLWEAALKPAGLTFQIDKDVLNIFPAEQK